MIKVTYLGRTGNNLFQYCFGRILAEKTGMKMESEVLEGFPNTKKKVAGKDYSNNGKRKIFIIRNF